MKAKIFKIRISNDFLVQDQKMLDDFMAAHEIIKVESSFVTETENFWSVLLFFEETKPSVREAKTLKYSAEDQVLSADEVKILESLKLWRTEKAKEQNLPSYFIATNKELISIAKYKPIRKEELMEIKGFGKHKIENYGEEIIEILEMV